ncbi:hypothetical protein BC831DRAFT_248906 [Entophlyctis helioformis]|nr:hypothetical protein BC831DRAFT_248906 [Entophlyctis helioformis]
MGVVRRSSMQTADTWAMPCHAGQMVDGHNNDHDDSGDSDELQHGRSWWDKLPAELHAMILFRASDLHSFLARRPRNPDADTIHRIWAYACASNWPGDLFLLPNWSPISDRNGSTNAEPDADINRALVLVTARSFYARLCERFPQWTKSAFVTRRADGADDGRFTRAISTMPRLVHIPLRQAWTDLLDMRDPVALGRLALAHGHGKMLRYLALETGAIDVRGYEQQDAGGQSLLDEALGRGFVDVADVLVEAGLQGWAISPTKLAAAGQLASLQWMHSKRGLQCDRWPTDVLDTAARSGRLDMVKWLHRHRSDGCTTDAVDGALEMHHYQVATWLLAHRPEGCSPAWVCKMASQGRLDILQAMHTNPGVTFTVGVMDEAIRRNQLAVAEWLRANRSEGYSAKPVELALWHSSFDVARWLLSTCGEGCDDSAVNGVAARGRLDVIQTMHETGRVRFTAAVMDTAAPMDICLWCSGCTSRARKVARYLQWTMRSKAATSTRPSICSRIAQKGARTPGSTRRLDAAICRLSRPCKPILPSRSQPKPWTPPPRMATST